MVFFFYSQMCMVNLNVISHILFMLQHSNDKKKHKLFLSTSIIIYFKWTYSSPKFSFQWFSFAHGQLIFFKVEFCFELVFMCVTRLQQ
jgi:hypothetical protein